MLVLSNPDLGIYQEVAEAAAAAFADDGRSVNNVLGCLDIFRGGLRAGDRQINVEMKLAAARAIADLAVDDQLMLDALDHRVDDAAAKAVGRRRERSGTAPPGLAAAGL